MSAYHLDPDESVILQDFNVTSNTGEKVTLVLSNHNIIQVTKDFWGNPKGISKYHLDNLKVLDGKPNVRVGKAPNGETRLELYFINREKFYLFKSILAERKWATAITKAYKSYMAELKKQEREENGYNPILTPLMNTLESAKDSIIPKFKDNKPRLNKCPRCGEELTGIKGEEVTCPYCDTVITIK